MVNENTITTLIQQRDTNYVATAYKNSANNLPRTSHCPMGKQGLLLLQKQIKQGISCPRKLLINEHTKFINANFEMELYNANTEEDYKLLQQWIIKQNYL
ncbi:MAG: hypothetical protein ACRC0A_07005 [Chitinophagaceae bacterium]